MDKTLALSFLFVFGCSLGNDDVVSTWSSFVESPSVEREQALMAAIGKDIEGCGWGKPENLNAVPDPFRQDLFDLIAGGDLPSYRVGLRIEKCLDGGDLGDFRRSAGLFFDVRPDTFLDESIRGGVSGERLAELVSALPLALADDPRRQRDLVMERISKLEQSRISSEPQVTRSALNALREHVQLLSDVIEEQG